MEASLDKFGRIVIPKEIRDALGLKPGSPLKIEEVNQEIHLSPIKGTPNLINKDGWLVFSGKTSEDLIKAIEELREERDKNTWGDSK